MQTVKIGWAGQTFAMARCSESNTKAKKTRNRLKKEERKSMVEAFINKYRKENNGSFPSLNLTHKEVGGSFYTVREIVRELIQENRVLAPGSSHSQVLKFEYSEDGAQLPLGTLSFNPASTFSVEINGHEVHEIGGGPINGLHDIKESEKVDDKTETISNRLTTTGDTDTGARCDQEMITYLLDFSENKDLVFSTHEGSISDTSFSTDTMQVTIPEKDFLKSKNQPVSMHDVSGSTNAGSVEVEQLAVHESASGSFVSDSVCLDEGGHVLVTKTKTEAISNMGLEELDSTEINTLDRRELTKAKQSEIEELQDALFKLGATEDLLSSFTPSCMDDASGLKIDVEGNLFSISNTTENSSITEEKRTDLWESRPPLSLDEIRKTHKDSSNIAVEEVVTNVGESISYVSCLHTVSSDIAVEEVVTSGVESVPDVAYVHNVLSNVSVEEVVTRVGESVPDVSYNPQPSIENEVGSLHPSTDDSSNNLITASEKTPEQLDICIKSEIPSASNAEGSGSLLLEGGKSGSFEDASHRPHVAREEFNLIVSALKAFVRALVKFLTSDF